MSSATTSTTTQAIGIKQEEEKTDWMTQAIGIKKEEDKKYWAKHDDKKYWAKCGDDKEKIKKTDTRITTPYITKFEKARILGTRALQISLGAPLMVEWEGESDPLAIAAKELREKKRFRSSFDVSCPMALMKIGELRI